MDQERLRSLRVLLISSAVPIGCGIEFSLDNSERNKKNNKLFLHHPRVFFGCFHYSSSEFKLQMWNKRTSRGGLCVFSRVFKVAYIPSADTRLGQSVHATRRSFTKLGARFLFSSAHNY